MGRKKKYFTEEERKNAQKKYSQDYYVRNKEIIDKKSKDYYELRKSLQSDNRESKI
jgi:hypothetical protein